MKNKIAMIDLDGTLVNTKDVNYNAYKSVLLPYGIDLDYNYFCINCNGKKFTEFMPWLLKDFQFLDKSVMNKIHEEKKKIYSNFLYMARLNNFLVDIIKNLKDDYYIVLVTTASRTNSEEILKYFRIMEYFDLLITQEDVINEKPDPEGYMKALHFYNIKKENTVIFEDSDVGILAAKESGIKYFVVNGYN